MKNVKFRGKKTNSAKNSAVQNPAEKTEIPLEKPKFRGRRKTVGPNHNKENQCCSPPSLGFGLALPREW